MIGAARAFLVAIVCAAVACGDERTADDQASDVDPSAATEDSVAQETLVAAESVQARSAIEMLQGRILETGPAHSVTVTMRLDDSTAINLIGDLESELHNLSGATVAVEGHRRTAHPTLGTFDVYRYQVLDIDGVKPEVGIIEAHGTEWFLIVGDVPVALASVPDVLKTRDGAKVWIIGERTPTQLRVQSYGIIRDR